MVHFFSYSLSSIIFPEKNSSFLLVFFLSQFISKTFWEDKKKNDGLIRFLLFFFVFNRSPIATLCPLYIAALFMHRYVLLKGGRVGGEGSGGGLQYRWKCGWCLCTNRIVPLFMWSVVWRRSDHQVDFGLWLRWKI